MNSIFDFLCFQSFLDWHVTPDMMTRKRSTDTWWSYKAQRLLLIMTRSWTPFDQIFPRSQSRKLRFRFPENHNPSGQSIKSRIHLLLSTHNNSKNQMNLATIPLLRMQMSAPWKFIWFHEKSQIYKLRNEMHCVVPVTAFSWYPLGCCWFWLDEMLIIRYTLLRRLVCLSVCLAARLTIINKSSPICKAGAHLLLVAAADQLELQSNCWKWRSRSRSGRRRRIQFDLL